MGFYEISILLTLAGILGIFAKIFKQPLIVGYLLTGILLTYLGLKDIISLANMGQIGVTLLLFLLGLEMKLSELPYIGRVALIAGISQILLTFLLGFITIPFLGFGIITSLYISGAITFSSTIIVVKLLSEKKDLGSLYGRIAVGVLLVQDFVAIFILIFLASLDRVLQNPYQLLLLFAKLIFVVFLVLFLSKKFLPYFFEKFVLASTELSMLVSIAWVMFFSTLIAKPIGFSLEVGGLLAGLALSNLPEHLQIAARTKPLKDFFLIPFFVYLGTQLTLVKWHPEIILPLILITIFVLIIKPLVLLGIVGILGYKRRTSFMVALTASQVSEFSLILMSQGKTLGHLQSNDVAIVVLIAVVTMTVSTYLINASERIYKRIFKILVIFERKRTMEQAFMIKDKKFANHIVLIGCDRTGKTLASYFLKKDVPFLVVDFNPQVFSKLKAEGIPCIFGDITDPEIIEATDIRDARLIISTIPTIEDNLTIIEFLKSFSIEKRSIFIATSKKDAITLYESGAAYVVVPEMIAGEHIKHLLRFYGFEPDSLLKLRKAHFNKLLYT